MQSLWMLVASFLFSIMGVCVKLASDYYPTAEIVAFRGLIGMAMILVLVKLQGGSLRTRMPFHHLWRGFIGVIALWMWFYAITKLPLAMAVTLNYMSPVWMAIILFAGAWLHGKKRVEAGLAIAILLGFTGVVLLLRPSIHADQMLGGMIGLGSGILSALAYIQVRQMGLMGEPEYRVVFYFSTTCFVAGMLGVTATEGMSAAQNMSDWHHHGIKSFLLLLAIGLTAASAQIAMTRAYRLGNPLVVANLQYVGIVFSSAWDVLLWHDVLKWQSWLGIAIILASGLIATFYNSKNNKPVVASDPISSE